ncbi:MAG: hypothetical protein GY786_11690, partial [Proteobacteria bacterium]|nr:hypothetical protein [Pseudomonadota bacterium]
NIWDTLSKSTASQRQEVLLNIDPVVYKNAALRVGDYKLITGESGYWSGWFPPPESTATFHASGPHHEEAAIKCGKRPENVTRDCSHEHGPCLFDIENDPCEYTDISKEYPDILQALLVKLQKYREGMVKPRNNFTNDPLSDPKLHGGSWEPWLKPSSIN